MTDIIIAVQLFFGLIIGLYFLNLYKTQKSQKSSIEKESRLQMNKLQHMRTISLTMPLSEKTRPTTFEDMVGQEAVSYTHLYSRNGRRTPIPNNQKRNGQDLGKNMAAGDSLMPGGRARAH